MPTNFFTCPVCDYGQLPLPPEREMICPQCGTQFGLHDIDVSHEELRRQWIENGRKWHSKRIDKP